MAYQPKVIDAKVVSENPNNGYFEIVAELHDRNRCRLTFEKDPETGTPKVTHVNRLYTVPCGICKKDFLCYCLNRYMDDIGAQALEFTGKSKVS
ncbi:hypothetical protein [Gorillibacterium sp. sgz5001074]|uniref:hypothetical protein n=1 Tax=Gorillibacterium sp. sgz5001074 TaxID=3446695 RepID=UPI003F664060